MNGNGTSKRLKVLCPVGKGERTFWLSMGMAFVNRDNSINVYLDGLPVNGKLQLRDWDEPRKESPEDRDLRASLDKDPGALPF